jgi:hypothetical protein
MPVIGPSRGNRGAAHIGDGTAPRSHLAFLCEPRLLTVPRTSPFSSSLLAGLRLSTIR